MPANKKLIERDIYDVYLNYYKDRWRYLKYKEDGINRFPKPTKQELLIFNFKTNLYKRMKIMKKQRQPFIYKKDPLSESSDYSSDWEYFSEEYS